MHERIRNAGYGIAGVVLLAATAMVLLWPGALALTDRIPLGVLFGIPTAVAIYRLRRGLASA